MVSTIFAYSGLLDRGDDQSENYYSDNGESAYNAKLQATGLSFKQGIIAKQMSEMARLSSMSSGAEVALRAITGTARQSFFNPYSAAYLSLGGMMGNYASDNTPQSQLGVFGLGMLQLGLGGSAVWSSMFTRYGDIQGINSQYLPNSHVKNMINTPYSWTHKLFNNNTAKEIFSDFDFTDNIIDTNNAINTGQKFTNLSKVVGSMKAINIAGMVLGTLDTISAISQAEYQMRTNGEGASMAPNIMQRYQNIHTKTYQDSRLTQKSSMELSSSITEITQQLSNLTYKRNTNGIKYLAQTL